MVVRKKTEHSLTKPEFVLGFLIGGLFATAMFTRPELTLRAFAALGLLAAAFLALRVLFARERKRLAGRSRPAHSALVRFAAFVLLCLVLAAALYGGFDYLGETLRERIAARITPARNGEILILAVEADKGTESGAFRTAQALAMSAPVPHPQHLRPELVEKSWTWYIARLTPRELAELTRASAVVHSPSQGTLEVAFRGERGAFRGNTIYDLLGPTRAWQFESNPQTLQTAGALGGAVVALLLDRNAHALREAEEALNAPHSLSAPFDSRLHAVAGIAAARLGRCLEAQPHLENAVAAGFEPRALQEARESCRAAPSKPPEPPEPDREIRPATGRILPATGRVLAATGSLEQEVMDGLIDNATPRP